VILGRPLRIDQADDEPDGLVSVGGIDVRRGLRRASLFSWSRPFAVLIAFSIAGDRGYDRDRSSRYDDRKDRDRFDERRLGPRPDDRDRDRDRFENPSFLPFSVHHLSIIFLLVEVTATVETVSGRMTVTTGAAMIQTSLSRNTWQAASPSPVPRSPSMRSRIL